MSLPTGDGTVSGEQEPDWDAPLVLVIDPVGADTLGRPAALTHEGFRLVWCASASEGLVRFGELEPAAVVVAPDLLAPDTATVVSTIRRLDTDAEGARPILVGIGELEAELAGAALAAGATGAVGRPYDGRELALRLQHLVAPEARSQLRFGPLQLDLRAHTVRLDGHELSELPLKEFELLRVLMARADGLVPFEEISEALWHGSRTPSSNTISVHAGRLRRRLAGRVVVRTVRGLGYRLTLPEQSSPARWVRAAGTRSGRPRT